MINVWDIYGFHVVYAIIKALAKFRHYLLGHKFVIKTNQESPKDLLEQQLKTLEQQQWYLTLWALISQFSLNQVVTMLLQMPYHVALCWHGLHP